MINFLYAALALIPALFIGYCVGIQYQRRGIFYVLIPIAIVTAVIDVIANYTELSLIFWELPRAGEHTFSQRLYRLQNNTDWRGTLARPICVLLNKISFIIHIRPNPIKS